MQVNSRLFHLTKAKDLQGYISHLETAYEVLRLFPRNNSERIEEVNEQLKPTKFINIGQQDSK